MPPLRAIFFDNDGVLMDTERHYFAATAAALQARGVPFTREDFIELHMRQAKGAWHLLAERGYDAAAIDAARLAQITPLQNAYRRQHTESH